jgi:secretion/DNA translocation related TadE-like protein
VWTLALVQVLLLVALAIAVIGGIAVTRQRVATVADLAALAGAQALADVCSAASAVATGNGMAVASCRTEEDDVLVEVDGPVPAAVARVLALLGHSAPTVRQAARAGPPSS